jgi:hypothetical protein
VGIPGGSRRTMLVFRRRGPERQVVLCAPPWSTLFHQQRKYPTQTSPFSGEPC